MNEISILSELNEEQQDAVTAPSQNLLILAGAGSGKTRVLVQRIAWLIQQQQVPAFSIYAVTFTNKAAQEMRSRIEQLLRTTHTQDFVSAMWIGTFHSHAHRLLRLHYREAQLGQYFQVIDSEDQYRLIKRLLKELNLSEQNWAPKQIQHFINQQKDLGKRAKDIEHHGDFYLKTLLSIYAAYEQFCLKSDVVDFAELLLRAQELLIHSKALLEHYQHRFRHILVDEFQDTNSIQYAFIKLLAGQNQCVMAVGDDDQSIYGWRGAKADNIQEFARDFPNTRIIRLEENYRSTAIILEAANKLIEHNQTRMGKTLRTRGPQGEPILLYRAFNETDEAHFIASEIARLVKDGTPFEDIAVLYRSNAQSRVMEEALIAKDIPYCIYGGLRFFERMEIKDALAYLRLALNPHDDASFERIINLPPRGIGDKTLSVLRESAKNYSFSLWDSLRKIVQEEKELSTRARQSLLDFNDLIAGFVDLTKQSDLSLSTLTQQVLNESGLLTHYANLKDEKQHMRVENLQELITATKLFQPLLIDETLSPLILFLTHASLEAGEGESADKKQAVQLMTLHSAKGLEFPIVFIAGMEEGLFPHRMSAEEPHKLEEERRLCYVGMTRAKQKVYLSFAEMRRLHGTEEWHRPSRFLKEIPTTCLSHIRTHETRFKPTLGENKKISSFNVMPIPLTQESLKKNAPFPLDQKWYIGQEVIHPLFGEGAIIACELENKHPQVTVEFLSHGCKKLILAYANLQIKRE